MKIYLFFLFGLLTAADTFAQYTGKQDSTNRLPPNNYNTKHRIRWVAAGNIAAYGGTMVALYGTWYKNYPQSNFHFFNDNIEWLQVDKAGHAWSSYSEGRASIAMWRWAGMSPRKSLWVGGLSGLGYQSIIEILDGFSAEWGFSWGDYLGNLAGSTLLIGQELGWKDQRISFKFSSHRNSYADIELSNRANAIYGHSFPERTLKDYNAQTYWLSGNIRAFLSNSAVPAWLNIAVGYGAGGMFGAVENRWVDKGGIAHDRTDIKRYRQWYIAPDIDFTRIHTKSKFLKTTLFLLNSFKFPAPSLEFSNNKFIWNWIHF